MPCPDCDTYKERAEHAEGRVGVALAFIESLALSDCCSALVKADAERLVRLLNER